MDTTGEAMAVQSLQDIESYLANFNKEISSNALYTTDTSAIYQTTNDTPTRLKLERSGDSVDATSPGSAEQSGFEADGLLALHGTPVGATPVGVDNSDEQDQSESLLEPGASQQQETTNYQTVTIVPSEVNQAGEVSYVLIVSQQDKEDEDDDANADLSIYDFKEEAKAALADSPGYHADEETAVSVKKISRRSVPPVGVHCNTTHTELPISRCLLIASNISMIVMCGFIKMFDVFL